MKTKLKLLPKFIISLVALGLILTTVISFFSYHNSKGSLEEMYANQVIRGSRAVADILSIDDVKDIMGKDGDKTEAYKRVTQLFNKIKKDQKITYLSLASRDSDSIKFYIDAFVEELGDNPDAIIPYGTDILYTDAAYDEIDLQKYLTGWELYQQNIGTDKPLITDNSYGYNYTAIAPILDENGKEIAEVQYILDMNEVRNSIRIFLRNIICISLIIILLALAGYVVLIKRTVLSPLKKLNSFTKEIVFNDEIKKQSIDLKTGDEIQELAESFNYMLLELNDYVENLERVTAEKERIGAELNVATHIQASMLPNNFPDYPQIDIYATMNPAKEVGGDFYDFFMIDDTHIGIVMADVSGKGVPAALFMVIGKTLIKDHTILGGDLGEIFMRVNDLLCESNSEGMFITAFEGVLNLETGELRYVNAGHEIPFIAKKGENFVPYPIKADFVLAGMDGMMYKSGSVMLNPGDKIFQYTDGVTEATNSFNELYGMKRLEQALGVCSQENVRDILKYVKKDVDEFVDSAPQFDDITMLCLEFKEKLIKS